MLEKEMMNVNEQVALINEGEMVSGEVVNPALQVFQATMKVFLNQLDAIDQKVTKKLRQSILAQMSLRVSSLLERQQLNAWITGSADQLQINIGLVDMQNCVHHAYHYACENIGPSETDELLEKAVQQAESMPVAREFSPRKLF